MKMSIHGKQLVVTDAIKKYAETKLGRVEKYHDSIIELDVSLSAVRTKTGSSHTAEVLAYLSGSTLKASCTDTDLYAAIDQVSDIIEAQLKKHKEKRAINYGQVPGVKKIKYIIKQRFCCIPIHYLMLDICFTIIIPINIMSKPKSKNKYIWNESP